ncbi:winged helix-turn-helix transcriptional regulator [Chryseobacterium mucoviscidosis]|uniref:Transcriptional regulator n=2 Tax=Chryseobacterium TaxID=59732 RepID=A0A202C802_9FLAO|nr:helix-turn-helix domain-containing protein [Chryseobacterium mucoviscidosis]OVE59913.1 transcriptional regulator [Chryseobacterium mucoviscidosis]
MENKAVRKTKEFTPGNCPVVYCMNIIGGKWKPSIIHMIRTDRNRYSVLLKNITEISKQTLTNQLRELETDGIIERIIFPEIPPRVEYNITDYGKTLLPIIDSMYQWGRQHMKTDNKGYCDEK